MPVARRLRQRRRHSSAQGVPLELRRHPSGTAQARLPSAPHRSGAHHRGSRRLDLFGEVAVELGVGDDGVDGRQRGDLGEVRAAELGVVGEHTVRRAAATSARLTPASTRSGVVRPRSTVMPLVPRNATSA